MKTLNRFMIFVGLLSISILNASENDMIGSVDPRTGKATYMTQKEYFMNILDGARQARAQGNYKEAGRTLYDLAQNNNAGGKFGPVVRPGTTVANAARRELDDMRAKGQFKDAMLARWND